jgi:hypothetical protein
MLGLAELAMPWYTDLDTVPNTAADGAGFSGAPRLMPHVGPTTLGKK